MSWSSDIPLARSLARRYRRSSEPLEDLEQVASLALVKAVEGFDPSRDTAFSSYAVPSIAGAIKRHLRDYGWSLRMPRDLQELALRVERVSDELPGRPGRRRRRRRSPSTPASASRRFSKPARPTAPCTPSPSTSELVLFPDPVDRGWRDPRRGGQPPHGRAQRVVAGGRVACRRARSAECHV
jgi:RNA polymerase sigma-B factor